MVGAAIVYWITNLLAARGVARAWRRGDYARVWGWLAVVWLNVTLTVAPPAAAAWIADRTGIEALPLLLACVCATASTICLFRMVQHLWGDQWRLPWAPASLPFGVVVIAAQLAAFAATPTQIGTSDPNAAPTIPVSYRAIFGAYLVASCLTLASSAWRNTRQGRDWSIVAGFGTQMAGWCCGCAFGLLNLLVGLDPARFADLYVRVVRPTTYAHLLLLTAGHFLPRVALRWGHTATYYRLWPLWSLLHRALDYPPVYRGDMARRWNWRPLLHPGDYAKWLVLGIEDRASDLRPYISAEDLGRIDAELARAGITGEAAGPARDAACLGLGLARLAAGQPTGEAGWRLGVPHGQRAEARYLARVNAALRCPLVTQIVRRLADQPAPRDRGEHHHDDVERRQRESDAEVLATGDAQRGHH